MPEDKGSYEHIELQIADNGFAVSFFVKEINPMEPQGTFNGDRMINKMHKEVFQASGDSSSAMRKALSEAISRLEELHTLNLGIGKEEKEDEEA